jgi:hypothetical protein
MVPEVNSENFKVWPIEKIKINSIDSLGDTYPVACCVLPSFNTPQLAAGSFILGTSLLF